MAAFYSIKSQQAAAYKRTVRGWATTKTPERHTAGSGAESVVVRFNWTGYINLADMTGVASPEKASGSKKKSERKCATKEEYRQLSSIMGVMNNLRKQVCEWENAKQQDMYVLYVWVTPRPDAF